MFIILEGIDGSGKSTLASELQKHGAVLLKGEDRFDDMSIDTFLYNIQSWSISSQYYIYDRSFLSDIVYRYIDKKSPAKYTLQQLYRFCEFTNLLIYCDTDKAFENSIARGEDNIVKKQTSNKLRELYKFCIDVINRYNLIKCIKYDYTSMTVEDVIKIIKEVQNAVR